MNNIFIKFKNSHIDLRVVQVKDKIVFKSELKNGDGDIVMTTQEFEEMIEKYQKSNK